MEEILNYANKVEKLGFQTIVLKAGEDNIFDINKIIEISRELKKQTKLNIAMALGEKSQREYRLMKEIGISMYILKHETSDPILYRKLHPDLKYSNKIKSIRGIKQEGIIAGSGITVGFPGQTIESFANDILLLQMLEIDFIDVIPYIPDPNTPIGKKFLLGGGYFVPAIGPFDIEEMINKIVSVIRIVSKKVKISSSISIKDNKGLNYNKKCGLDIIMQNVYKDA